jgi:hypothetical protein
MYIVQLLFEIGGALLFVAGITLLIRWSYSPRKPLIPKAPDTVCRCCYEPEAPFSGSICRACLYVRAIGAVEETHILENYEHELLIAERDTPNTVSYGHVASAMSHNKLA